jgi:hypothetical protein
MPIRERTLDDSGTCRTEPDMNLFGFFPISAPRAVDEL